MSEFVAIVTISLLGVLFWRLSGLIADILTPKILAWIRRRKKSSSKQLYRCPMLECNDFGCIYYDKEALQCRYAEIGVTLDPEVTDDV